MKPSSALALAEVLGGECFIFMSFGFCLFCGIRAVGGITSVLFYLFWENLFWYLGFVGVELLEVQSRVMVGWIELLGYGFHCPVPWVCSCWQKEEEKGLFGIGLWFAWLRSCIGPSWPLFGLKGALHLHSLPLNSSFMLLFLFIFKNFNYLLILEVHIS